MNSMPLESKMEEKKDTALMRKGLTKFPLIQQDGHLPTETNDRD